MSGLVVLVLQNRIKDQNPGGMVTNFVEDGDHVILNGVDVDLHPLHLQRLP